LFGGLTGLAEIFPRPCAQLEDLMFSACFTAYAPRNQPNWDSEWVILNRPELLKAFPNLKTAWGYQSLSPSFAFAEKAICAWATASRDAGAANAILDAAKRQRHTQGAGLAVAWTRGANGMEPGPHD
jgi:hypothetical protein